MAVMKSFESFDNKEDIFELIDKFDKSSLVELTISITPLQHEKEITIKMMKLASESHRDSDNSIVISEDIVENGGTSISLKKNIKSDDSKIIKAPLIGTFYAMPSPDSEAYVKIGDRVEKGAVLCIIEAMKIMNEIESETDGEIAEIFVKNGVAVEYGQPLFRLK